MVMTRPPAALRTRAAEKKTVDVNTTTVSIHSTGTWTILNALQEGAGFYNRIGRKVQMRSLQLNGYFTRTGQASGQSEYLRVMILYDRQPNGAFPSVADILRDVNQAGTTSSTSLAGLNMDNAERFMILMDNRVNIPNASNTASENLDDPIVDQNNEINTKRYIQLRGLEAHYKSSNGDITDLSTGSLFLFTFGNVASGSNSYQFTFKSRLRYVDS